MSVWHQAPAFLRALEAAVFDRQDRRWLWGFSLAVMVVTTLPYLLAYQLQGDTWRYTGFVFGVEDGNSYIAKMLIGSAGDWLFRTPYTAYPQRGFLAFLPYLLLGKLAAPPATHEQLVALFHLFRLAGILAYIHATDRFLTLFLNEPRWRRCGVALVTLGGGLGWLSLFGLTDLWKDGLPLDFYSPETFGFLMVFGLPHLAFARAFLLWGVRAYLVPPDPGRDLSWLRAGLFLLGVALMQPLTVVVAWALIGSHLCLTAAWNFWLGWREAGPDWQTWKHYLLRAIGLAALPSPLVLYTLLSFRLDPFLRGWEGQNLILSPPPLDYLLAFAVILPLAVFGIAPVMRRVPWQGWFIIAWVAVFPLLAYAPHNLQRRLPEGVWVAWTVLAMMGLAYGLPAASAAWQRWGRRWLWLAFPSAFLLVLGSLLTIWKPALPLFRPAEEVAVFHYLAEQTPPGTVVLASYKTSNALPAWAPVRTLIGHGPESINGPQVGEQVDCFFQPENCTNADRLALLQTFRVGYVLWEPDQSALNTWSPAELPGLALVFQEGPYQLYQVQRVSSP